MNLEKSPCLHELSSNQIYMDEHECVMRTVQYYIFFSFKEAGWVNYLPTIYL